MKFSKLNPLRLNQSGSVSIAIALVVVTFGGLMVLQLASAFLMSNRLHQTQSEVSHTLRAFERISHYMQQSHQLALLDPSCKAGAKSTQGNLVAKTINGAKFCLPKNGEICVEVESSSDEEKDETKKECIASAPAALNWKIGSAKKLVPFSKAEADKDTALPNKQVVKNKITIPPVKDLESRSCKDAACLRLSLCPTGKSKCSESAARATQIVRLGALADPKVIDPPQLPSTSNAPLGSEPQQTKVYKGRTSKNAKSPFVNEFGDKLTWNEEKKSWSFVRPEQRPQEDSYQQRRESSERGGDR